MAQYTALEWFYEETIIKGKTNYYDLFEQAKAMEKEQIKEGYIMSLLDDDNKIRRDAEEYYNETYKK